MKKRYSFRTKEKTIIKFNLGDPDLPTPPEIIEAAYEAMKQGKTKYSSAAGERYCEKNWQIFMVFLWRTLLLLQDESGQSFL